MKQRYLKYIFALIISLIFLMPNNVSAVGNSYDYTIKTYNIDMVVNENNTFDITETIIADFNIPKHGIYRKIPLKNSVTRIDGTKSNNRAKITNLSVNENYTVSNQNGYKVIKIGTSDKTFTGSHVYTIKYTYDIGKDPLKNADELYFNLIGDEWDTSISNVNFKITMPKSFDKSLLGFSSGRTGSINSSNVYYTVNDNIITGSLAKTLYEGQALTVRLTLPEGYFVGASSNIDIFFVLVIIFCLICIIIADRLWSKYGKDDKVIETVEFYPPEGCNSAEVQFLYDGVSDTKGIISLLVYLADKGYLKIENNSDLEKNNIRITKLKEYDGDNGFEREFFEGLFSKYKDSVTISYLKDRFYETFNKIKSTFNSEANKNLIFESKSHKKSKIIMGMIIAIYALITIKPILEYGDVGVLITAMVFPVIGFSIVIGTFTRKTGIPEIIPLIFGVIFGGMPLIYHILPIVTQSTTNLVMYIIGVICIVVLVLFIKIMPKRTPYGTEMLGKIKGFKRFLETAEKEQLESLVEENYEYFYNILPYTYALGVSDVWMNQFESIAIQPPNWYDCSDTFDIHDFNHFMNSTIIAANHAMSYSPYGSDSYSGGSSDSGGGSSGGGSGGGGGGSW